MSSVVYAIVFKGEVLEGFQSFAVKAHMSKLLKADAEKMAKLFSGKQVVLKRTPDKQQAIKLGTALKKMGADVTVRAIKSAAPAAEQRPAAGARAGEGGLTLAPNVGNIVEPAPAPPPPDIDISGLSASEIGDSTLQEPGETVELDLDLSEYSVADPDSGEPLVEPKPEVPKVDAPDFGLDEPGAVLETLKVEVEEVHPDISDLSLAEAGADLLEESEKPKEPEPEVPDISELDLAPQP